MSSQAVSQATSFSNATAIQQVKPHLYAAHLVDDWCIGSVPHGGYVTSCFLRVASLHFATTLAAQDQPHCLTLHLEFLRRTQIGAVDFKVKDVKLGARTSTLHIVLSQEQQGKESREEVAGYITHTNFGFHDPGSTDLSLPTKWALHPPPPPANIDSFVSDSDSNWAYVETLPFSTFRKAGNRVAWCVPRNSADKNITGAYSDQWLSLNTTHNGRRERFTNDTLGFVVDMFTQLIEGFMNPDAYRPPSELPESKRGKIPTFKYWYPTVCLNMEVKKELPAEGVEWLFVRVLSKSIRDGRYDVEVIVLDQHGELVCLSQHVCFAVSVSRNTAERGGQNGRETKSLQSTSDQPAAATSPVKGKL